jgi:osmoprotectant transport system permease protein
MVEIAIATIGAKFGAGGLGVLLFDGIAQAGRYDKIWAGAIAISTLAFALNGGFLLLEWLVHPTRRVSTTISAIISTTISATISAVGATLRSMARG